MEKYRNSGLDIEERITDLLDRMTAEEMILQTDQYFSFDFTKRDAGGRVVDVDMEKLDEMLHGNSVGSIQTRGLDAAQLNEIQRYAVERTRLGIPFLFSEEALHGLYHRDATCFPQQIGLAATFHPELGYQMGHAIAKETRAMGIHETYSPVMDLIRDPRYGRAEESYGEDTHLCAEFAREVVRGMQGTDLKAPDAVAAEPKHYAGYGAPVAGLNCAPAAMGRHEVFTDCLPVFEAAFAEGGAMNAMCSYNAIDGIPVAADHELLTEILRDRWKMRGFVRSDLTAVARLYDNHHVAESRTEAMAMGLEAGVDLQLYDFPHAEWQEGLRQLTASGRLSMDVVRQACRRVLRVKFMLGLFEQPYTDETRQEACVHCKEHLALAREIARESITLLKNEDGLLPLKKRTGTIAVLGPGAGEAALGDYTPYGKTGVSILEGIRSLVPEETRILYDKGCTFLGDTAKPFEPGMLTDEDGNPGLTGRYYNGRTPAGEPVVTRNDPAIHFNWIFAKPHPDLDANCYSVVWTGYVTMPSSFQGCIGFSTQDSMRLYIDGELVLDGWGESRDANRMVDFFFEQGRAYAVRVEFTNDQRGARVIFGYETQREDFSRAVWMAEQADVAVVCVGDNAETCGENLDRVSLNLPGNQLQFVKAIHATGTPVVLVVQSGRPVTLTWEQANIPAILEAWFPGEEGGYAVAETLFGENNPSGRLPMTFPRHVGQVPCHYSRRPGGGRRYVEMTWLPLYPFGYGLSYTSFEYRDLKLSSDTIRAGEPIGASLTVTNTGPVSGTAVVQLYLRDVVSSVVKPVISLAAFARVPLEAGESRTVSLQIGPKAMRTLSRGFEWTVEPGEFQVLFGENAENLSMRQSFRVV